MKKIVGIFGGSFDPPHLGHYQLVQAALNTLPLDEVWVIPAGKPVHRTLSGCADGSQRVDWLNRMFADEKNVEVLDWEVSQDKVTPAIDTLRWIREEHADVQATWLMGTDVFASFPSWVEYPMHRDLCSMAVFSRVGCADPAVPSEWRSGSIEQLGNVRFLNVDIADISASQVRQKMQQGGSLEGLVCESIREEIEALYAGARSISG